jgi:hypothetical protein
VWNVNILVAVVQKNAVLFIDANGLAKTRFAHLPAYAVRVGSRRKREDGGQRASGSRHDRDRTHGPITLESFSSSARQPARLTRSFFDQPGRLEASGFSHAEFIRPAAACSAGSSRHRTSFGAARMQQKNGIAGLYFIAMQACRESGTRFAWTTAFSIGRRWS